MVQTCFLVFFIYILVGCAVAFVAAEEMGFLRQDVRNYIPYLFTMLFLWPVWLWVIVHEKLEEKTIRIDFVILGLAIIAILGIVFTIFAH